ncbi:unnamed protein product [Schistosoma curassoni]|uniref:Dolichyl-diphosphooligosaccharide--protein glycosyltransferase subunit 2 n=1 Tax=Schistosoma curassoni TaxID=6186 RepID=A0A183K6W1_9TREM|nr:unnamed protein product [Schistosoma curassoni]
MQLDDLDFADDLTLLSHMQQRMQEKTTSVAEASAAVGLNIHKEKSKILRYSTACNNRITFDGEALEDATTLTYLGSIIDEQGGSDADVKERIGKARATYLQLKNVWNSKQLSTNTKTSVVQPLYLLVFVMRWTGDMFFVTVVLLIAHILAVKGIQADQSNTLFIGSISVRDKNHFRSVFERQINESPSDASKVYHAILGLHSLGERVPNPDDVCSSLNKPITNPEEALYVSAGHKIIGSSKCKVSISEVEKLSKQLLTEDISIENLFYLVSSMKNLNIKIDASHVLSIINKIKDKDTSPMTLSFVLQILSQIGLTKSNISGHYEKGLYTTSFVAKSIIDFLTAYGEVPNSVENKLVKLFNHLYTRRQTTNVRASAYLVAAFKSLTDSPLLLPVVIESSVKSKDLGLSIPPTLSIDQTHPILDLRLKHIWTDIYFKPSEFNLKAHGVYAIKRPTGDRILSSSSDLGAFKQDDKK